MQPSSKSAAAVPKLNSEMEMGSLPADEPAPENDIMQLARIGDIPGMEKLFESGEFDATYTDGEGITPLHVSAVLRVLDYNYSQSCNQKQTPELQLT
jgi:palmitoyltransferase